MGPFVLKTFQAHQVPRKDPPLEIRIAEYTAFLRRTALGDNVPLVDGDRVLVGLQGGGLALVTSLPEVLDKARQRQGIKYKRGDVLVIIDLLREVKPPVGYDSQDHCYFVKDNTGKRLQQTVHVGTLVLPPDLTNISRSATIPFTVLQAEVDQFEGLDVLRIGSAGLEILKEHGADLVVD